MTAVSGIRDQVTSQVYPLSIPLPPDPETGWKPYPVFRGSTEVLHSLSCHASVLSMNHIAHPPHSHKEEEILLLLSGEVDLILPDEKTPGECRRKRLTPGEFVYYPKKFPHTLQAVGKVPSNYLMYQWHNAPGNFGSPLAFSHFRSFSGEESTVGEGFHTHLVFEGPTTCLRKLHCHASTLMPGAGYDPHSDPYDVAMVVLEGEIETLGVRVGPHGVIFYRAGELHGVTNPGATAARYLVFEFHGTRSATVGSFAEHALVLRVKQAIPPLLRGKVKQILRRIGRVS